MIVAKTIKGKGVEGGREQGGLARQGARRPRGGDRGARRDPQHRTSRSRSRTTRASRTCSRPATLELPTLRARRGGRDAQGVRRRARGARRRRAATSSRSTARSRTRPSPRSSRRRTRSATSRCSSPSSSWSRRRSGLQVRGWKPFASTFAAFFSRAYDFVRMAAISRANIKLCGSHAGVSIGEDGPSQMALEDLAMLRAVHGSTVLYPSRREPDGEARRGDGRPRRHRLPAHDARRTRRSSTAPTRSSRSAAARSCARRRRRGGDRRGGHHAPRGAQGRRRARGGAASAPA